MEQEQGHKIKDPANETCENFTPWGKCYKCDAFTDDCDEDSGHCRRNAPPHGDSWPPKWPRVHKYASWCCEFRKAL